jgi:hypothetical protein
VIGVSLGSRRLAHASDPAGVEVNLEADFAACPFEFAQRDRD